MIENQSNHPVDGHQVFDRLSYDQEFAVREALTYAVANTIDTGQTRDLVFSLNNHDPKTAIENVRAEMVAAGIFSDQGVKAHVIPTSYPEAPMGQLIPLEAPDTDKAWECVNRGKCSPLATDGNVQETATSWSTSLNGSVPPDQQKNPKSIIEADQGTQKSTVRGL